MEPCIVCSRAVRARQHAVQCDDCKKWQHRICGTGISQDSYRRMVRGELNINCSNCKSQMDVTTDATESVKPSSIDDSTITMPDGFSGLGSVLEDAMADESRQSMMGRSFDVPDRDFQHQPQVHDVSISEPALDDVVPEDNGVKYEIVEKGTKRGGRMLVSNDGYSYNVKREKGGFTYWWCSVRSTKLQCSAWVKQYGETFISSSVGHQHPANPGIRSKVKVSAKVKELAAVNIQIPASRLVQQAVTETVQQGEPYLPNVENLTRATNLHRQHKRPKLKSQ